MCAAAVMKSNRPAAAAVAAMRAAVAQVIEPLESRVLFDAGDLDLSFNGTGKVTLDYLNRNNFAQAVSVQSDGRIVVAGFIQTQTTTGNDLLVARFNADGSLDATFGASGIAVTNLGSTLDNAVALAVQPDGKIVVGAQARGAGNTIDFAVVRYNANGSLDAGFGTGGVTLHDLGGGVHDTANAMTLTGDGRIVLVGTTTVGGVSQFAVTRYTSAGVLDGTFGGGDGIVVHSFTGGSSEAKAVAALADGSLVVAGRGGSHFAAIHLSISGALDASFGASAGWATVDLGGEFEVANGVAVLGDGRVVLAGESEYDFQQDVAVARLTAGGLVDTTFGGGDGFVLTDFDGDYDYGAAVRVLPSGHIVVAGSAYVNFASRFAAVRYLADGTLDADFGSGGKVNHTFASESTGKAMALDADGRLVIAGQALNLSGNFDFAVARLDNTVDSNLPPVAHAGGPYLVNAGGTVLLDGSGSSDVDGSIVSYEWDFSYTGSSFDVDATGVAPTFSGVGLSGPAVLAVALRVTDNQGATHIATTTLIVNALPVAHAGGTYLVNAGASVQLDGTGSSDADGTIVSYEWDFDYSGSAFNTDASGATVTFSAAGLSGPAVRTVALRVTDEHGATHLVTTTVTINALPVANAGGPYAVFSGESVVLNGGASGDADGSIASYEWDFNYDGVTFNADATGATPSFSAVGLAPTVRTVALRVTDEHGATSLVTTSVTVSVRPGSALVVDDPLNPGTKMLLVQGTNAADTLRFRGVGGSLEVKLGNQVLGTFAGFSRVVIDGGAGDDVIDGGFVALPVVIFGGAGNDKLTGGSNHDVLVGGAGNDQLDGGAGDDVIGGGAGADDLDGRYGNDLLLGAALAYEGNRGALQGVLAEWSRTDLSLSQRIAHLLGGGGHNGSFTLSGADVVEDNATDSLSGTDGADWLLAGPGDKVQKLKK